MVEIKKDINNHGYNCFEIITDEGKFDISFQGNLDLYWNYSCRLSEFKTIDKKEFVITKENYYLYSLFDNLYMNVLSGITIDKDLDIFFDETDEDCFYDSLYPYNLFDDGIVDWDYYLGNNLNENFIKKHVGNIKFNSERLLKNGVIDWHSDDYPYDEGSRVIIKQEDDRYIITFYKSKDKSGGIDTFSVRFSNHGSTYEYFNTLFMDMYHKLGEYDPNNYQIHIEEYLYKSKKLERK